MATAVGTVQEQVASLEAEVSELTTRLAGEEKDLEALERERGAVSEQIVLGKEKPSRASTIARQVEETEARVNGLRSILARKQVRLDELWPELRRIEAENRLASRRAEVGKLEQQGAAAAERINRKITELLTEDFVAFDQIRDELAELGDAGGSTVAYELLGRVGNSGESSVLKHLINQQRWMEGNVWNLRGDIILTLRNLWPPKK